MARIRIIDRGGRDVVAEYIPSTLIESLKSMYDDRFGFWFEGTTVGNRVTVNILYTPEEFLDPKSLNKTTGFELRLGSVHLVLAGEDRIATLHKIAKIVATAEWNEKYVRQNGYPWGRDWPYLKPIKTMKEFLEKVKFGGTVGAE